MITAIIYDARHAMILGRFEVTDLEWDKLAHMAKEEVPGGGCRVKNI